MIRTIAIGIVGMLGTAATTAVGATGSGDFNIEGIGVAGITVAILLYLLKDEREKRQADQVEYRKLGDEIRTKQSEIIEKQTIASGQQASAMTRVAETLDRLLDKITKGG